MTLNSLLVHHSVMPEMLPCPLSLTRYNQSMRGLQSAKGNIGCSSAPDYEDALDYLDPSNESDYELISRLREGLGNGFSPAAEDEEFDTIQPYNSVTAADIEAPSVAGGGRIHR